MNTPVWPSQPLALTSAAIRATPTISASSVRVGASATSAATAASISAFGVPWKGFGWIRSRPGTIAAMSACQPPMRSSEPCGVGATADGLAAAVVAGDGDGRTAAGPVRREARGRRARADQHGDGDDSGDRGPAHARDTTDP